MTISSEDRPELLFTFSCELQAASSVEECGGKAFHLKRMLDRQIPVPAGIVVTNRAFQTFLNQNSLRSVIDEHLQSIDLKLPESCRDVSVAIQGVVMDADVPDIVREALAVQLANFHSDQMLIVRSSAVGEDSKLAAFAGQLDSILHVEPSLDAVCQALKACWASYWSARVLFYQRTRGAFLNGMGVVIQHQVDASLSGVMFTQSLVIPSSNQDPESADSMLVEFCTGLADQLVSGQITPGRILISRQAATFEVLSWPEGMQSSVQYEDLLLRFMPQLAAYGMELETELGGPQDIEWTVSKEEELFLVQSRPITVITGDAIPGTTAKRLDHLDTNEQAAKTIVWSNANVNENFPDPICPLLYSIAELGYYHYFRNLGRAFGISNRRIEAMELPLRNIVGVHAGRLYYNLTNIHSVLRMAPFGEKLTESFNLFVGAERTERVNPHVTWGGFARGWLRQVGEIATIAIKTSWKFLFLSRHVVRFERTIDEFAARTHPHSLATHTVPELLDDLRGFLAIRCHRWLDASLADAAAMFSYSLLKRFLNREYPARDASALHNSLLKGLSDVVSGTPMLELWKLSRRIRDDSELRTLFKIVHTDECDATFVSSVDVVQRVRSHPSFHSFRIEFDRFLNEWGFRCSGELMLTVPSFQERPEALVDILRSYASLEGESPAERLDRQNAERLIDTAEILQQLHKRWLFKYFPWPKKSWIARRLLRWTQGAILYRERVRLKQALLYSRCRQVTLAIGSRLTQQQVIDQAEDAFFLTIQELQALLSGSSMFPHQIKELVALRRNAHDAFTQQRPPDTLSLPFGANWTPQVDSAPDSETPGKKQGGPITGIGVCGGVVTARAAVLHDVTEQGQLSVGDILVTRQTDPGWGPVFMLIQGLVMERGGMLSHGAILAREYGLPTVVGIPDATQRIHSGQKITVNGDCGHVELF